MLDSLQHLGAISIALLAVGLAVIPLVWPYDVRHTFSQHVARHKSSFIYYIVMFSVFLPMFMLFFIKWFAPHTAMPLSVVIIACIAAITQLACTFIPETTGWKRAWHRALAGASGFGLVPVVVFLATTSTSAVRIVSALCVLAMIILSTTFLLSRHHSLGESYWIQVFYYAAFFLPIMLATYL